MYREVTDAVSASHRWLSALLVVLGSAALAAAPLHAQVADTTGVADSTQVARPDSMRTPPRQPPTDSLGTPLPFLSLPRGTSVLDVLPIQHHTPDIAHLLAPVPGAFLFDLGANGWPHGWSWEGLAPHRAALLFDGHPYNDPVTGRPRFDLLPPEFLRHLHTGTDRLGGPVTVYAQPRFYDTDKPLTELHYRRDNNALQSIAAVHAQQRRISVLGDPGLLQVVGGYAGRAADNEYPNSDLRRERRLFARVQYRQERWSVALRNLHSRRKIGAQGGVMPQFGVFETVYNRSIAQTVRNAQARRQTIRNDFALTARAPLVPGLDAPLTASINWTAQTFRYYETGIETDTVGVKTNGYSGYLRQDVSLGPQKLFVEIGGTLDRVRETNAWAGHTTRRRLHATLRDSIALGTTTFVLDGGVHTGDQTYPSGGVHIAQQWGGARFFAEGRLTGQSISWIEEAGFEPFVQPLDDAPTGHILHGRLGASLSAGPFDAQIIGFAHEVQHPVDLYTTSVPDSLIARVSSQPFRRAGVTAQLGWRQDATVGLYASAQATVQRMLNPSASADNARVADTLPTLFGQGRLGARFVAFAGDLDADLYVQGRAWTAMRSRVFHPQTGRFAVPLTDAPVMEDVPEVFGSAGTVDVTFEAGIHDATLFFTFENVMSGTTLQPGVLVVPVYPLPERRFRFGVFWPIWN